MLRSDGAWRGRRHIRRARCAHGRTRRVRRAPTFLPACKRIRYPAARRRHRRVRHRASRVRRCTIVTLTLHVVVMFSFPRVRASFDVQGSRWHRQRLYALSLLVVVVPVRLYLRIRRREWEREGRRWALLVVWSRETRGIERRHARELGCEEGGMVTLKRSTWQISPPISTSL